MTIETKFATALGIAVTSAGLLTGCGPTSSPDQTADALSHVHGLAADPSGEAIIVATHHGVYRLELSGPANSQPVGPVGGLDIDAMGFTLIGDVAYASGHPGPRTPAIFGSPNLGLIRSNDLGMTWVSVSLTGVTDFHDITISASNSGRIYGLAGTSLRRSDDDGETWTDLAVLEARDILTPANNSDLVYATTADGLLQSEDGGATFEPVLEAPHLYLLADGAIRDGRLVGIDTEGRIWSQAEEDGNWVQTGSVQGTPQALTVGEASGLLIVADDRGVMISEDEGQTWDELWTP